MLESKIINLTVRDVRFPTSLEQHGSDAMVRSILTVHFYIVFISVISEVLACLTLSVNVIDCSTPIQITLSHMLFSRRTRLLH